MNVNWSLFAPESAEQMEPGVRDARTYIKKARKKIVCRCNSICDAHYKLLALNKPLPQA